MRTTEFELDLNTRAADAIQCSVCGQPNRFGRLCAACEGKLAEVEAANAAVRRRYLVLGLRCAANEFRTEED